MKLTPEEAADLLQTLVMHYQIHEDTSVQDFMRLVDIFKSRAERAESADKQVYQLRNMILLLLDQVDYTSGACRPNEMVGAVLGANLIRSARELVRGGEE